MTRKYMTEEEHEHGTELFNFFYDELRRIVNERLKAENISQVEEEFVRCKLSESMRFWD